MASFQVVGGGDPTPEEVAAIAAALEVVLADRTQVAAAATVSPWRWSGRPWTRPDWRRSRAATHPSRP